MPLSAYDLTGRASFVTGAASALLPARAGAAAHCADRDGTGPRRAH